MYLTFIYIIYFCKTHQGYLCFCSARPFQCENFRLWYGNFSMNVPIWLATQKVHGRSKIWYAQRWSYGIASLTSHVGLAAIWKENGWLYVCVNTSMQKFMYTQLNILQWMYLDETAYLCCTAQFHHAERTVNIVGPPESIYQQIPFEWWSHAVSTTACCHANVNQLTGLSPAYSWVPFWVCGNKKIQANCSVLINLPWALSS